MAERFGGRGRFAFSGGSSGFCLVFNTKITRITGWRIHYCVPRVKN